MASVEIQLLGRFEVVVDGRPVPASAWRHRRAAGLIKLLALASGHREHREQLIEALWPHLPLERGERNLHKAIHLARRGIGDPSAITRSSQEVGLGGDVAVDVDRFERETEVALGSSDQRGCASAASLYTGELLPGRSIRGVDSTGARTPPSPVRGVAALRAALGRRVGGRAS
jgi:DNA-binding SARP family transcriptional activator